MQGLATIKALNEAAAKSQAKAAWPAPVPAHAEARPEATDSHEGAIAHFYEALRHFRLLHK